jgi:hypothetical protein
MTTFESLRAEFRPARTCTLFVGESPPRGGTFFYNEDSNLYRAIKACFPCDQNFLSEFKAKGFYLDDLVLDPVNQIKDRKARNEQRRAAISSFARRLCEYKPAAIVILMLAIEPMVLTAAREAQLSNPHIYVTPFPNQYHRKRFRAIMQEIIPKLPFA